MRVLGWLRTCQYQFGHILKLRLDLPSIVHHRANSEPQISAHACCIAGFDVAGDIVNFCNHRFELLLQLTNQFLYVLSTWREPTLKQASNMIGGRSGIMHYDVWTFAISAIGSGDTESRRRSPLYRSNVSLSLNVNPP